MTTRIDNTTAPTGGELQAAYAAAAGELSRAFADAGVEEGIGKLQDLLLECAESAKAFEAGMARIYTLLPGLSREACDQLRDDMLEFSGEMGVLTKDAIPAMYSALAAGVDGETIFDFLETAQKAAVVGSLDLGEAVEGLTSIVNAYGETSLEVREAADMLFTAVRLGQTDFQELMDCMGQIGPAAADAGVEFQDVAAALAALAARGVPASKAAAQLDGLLEDLSNSSSQAAQAFKNITGQTFSQFIESGGNVQKALQKLKEHADLTGVGINELFSTVESGRAALELTGPAADSFSAAVNQMSRSAGTMDIAYYGMSHTAEQASQQLRASVDNMKTAIGSALLPAFERLAHGAAAGLSWAADFVEEHPWVVAAVGAVTAALTVLTTGITVFTVAVKMARAAMDAFKAAAGPIGLVAIAITSVLAALTTYSLMTDDAANRTRELTDSLEESRKAYEEKKEAIAENNDNLLGMANALADLAEKENLSAVEKQIMLSLIDDLNERVPELALAYDEASDSLNRTSDAIRDLALAEAERTNNEAAMERLKELYVESAFIDYELARAAEELADAQADCADQTERSSAAAGVGMVGATKELTSGLREEHRAVRELTERQKENQEQIQALEAETNEYSQAMRKARDAGREQEDQTSALKRTGQGLLETTQRLIAEEDALSKAYEEQKKTGELSLETVLSLIEAGESRFLVIDSETGAVKLNTSAYIQARTAKIDDQIASLESHRLSIENKIALGEEALSALGVAEGYIAAAMAKSTLTEEKLKVEAQIQQLEKLKASIKSYSTTTTRAASAVRRASKTVKTQAEKDLEEFKRLKAALDHEKAMGERSEEGYYRKLKGYRDQYLTSKENLDTYRSITESIYKYEQDLMKEQLATYEDHLETMAESAADALDEIKRSYEEVLEKQEDMREKLSEYGALFTEEKDQPLVINDLKEQIQVLKDYEETLSLLRDQGIAQGLMNEILSMDVDSAIGYGRQLLEMDEESWVEYNEDWEQKQALAKEISERFFNDELETLRSEYDGKLKEALDSLKDTSYLSGLLTGGGFLDGLAAKEEEIYLKAKKIAEKVASTLSSAYGDTDGNRPKDGSHAAGLAYVPFDGYLAELHRGEKVLNSSEASAYIAASKPSPFTLPSEVRHSQRQTEAMVNAVGALTAGMYSRENGGDMTVVLQVNGTEFARATLEDFRHASDQSPRLRSDFV